MSAKIGRPIYHGKKRKEKEKIHNKRGGKSIVFCYQNCSDLLQKFQDQTIILQSIGFSGKWCL